MELLFFLFLLHMVTPLILWRLDTQKNKKTKQQMIKKLVEYTVSSDSHI